MTTHTPLLQDIGPQTLRLYERRGLIAPDRRGRDNLERLRRISDLVERGVNLTGIREILALEEERSTLRAAIARLTEQPPPPSGR